MNDQQLLAQITHKNPNALAELYDRYAPILLGCLCKAGERTQVEPLVEDVFYHLWEQSSTVMVNEDIWQWLLKTAFRCGREQEINLSFERIF